MKTLNSSARIAAAVLCGIAALAVSPLAAIVGHFHVSAGVAAAIVAAITSGATAVLLLYPWIIPVVGAVRLLLFFVGTGAAIGW